MTNPLLAQLTEQELLDQLQVVQQTKANNRKDYKDRVTAIVPIAVDKLTVISKTLSDAKKEVFDLFREVMDAKTKAYGVKQDKNQMTHTFSTDKYSITIGYRVNDGWDDTCHAGIKKINTFLESKAKDADSALLVNAVFRLLKKDAKGNLRANRVIDLKKMADDSNDAEFKDGVDIILKSHKPVRSCWFIEASMVNTEGKFASIPLSISAADFPAGFNFDFLADKK